MHFEIIPQAEAIRLHSRLMFSGLSVKLFLLSPQQQLTNHLASPFLYLVVRLLQWSWLFLWFCQNNLGKKTAFAQQL